MGTMSATREVGMADVKSPNLPRLISLFIAFLGCAVTALPFLYVMTSPAPVILVGSGITVVARAVFLFFSF
jgi:hypothetical protein